MDVFYVSALPVGDATEPLRSARVVSALFLAPPPVNSWSLAEQGRGNLDAVSRSTSDPEVGVYKYCFSGYFCSFKLPSANSPFTS